MKLNYGLRSSDKVIRKGFHSHFFRLNKKVLPIALVIMMAIQMVIPFYVLAQVNNNEPNKQVFVEGESYVVNSWEELKELIENGRYKDKQNNWVYIADPYNLNIIINGPIAANSQITIPSTKSVSLNADPTNGAIIYGEKDNANSVKAEYRFNSMFNVDGGTLNVNENVIFSGKRAIFNARLCGLKDLDTSKSNVFYTPGEPLVDKYMDLTDSAITSVNKGEPCEEVNLDLTNSVVEYSSTPRNFHASYTSGDRKGAAKQGEDQYNWIAYGDNEQTSRDNKFAIGDNANNGDMMIKAGDVTMKGFVVTSNGSSFVKNQRQGSDGGRANFQIASTHEANLNNASYLNRNDVYFLKGDQWVKVSGTTAQIASEVNSLPYMWNVKAVTGTGRDGNYNSDSNINVIRCMYYRYNVFISRRDIAANNPSVVKEIYFYSPEPTLSINNTSLHADLFTSDATKRIVTSGGKPIEMHERVSDGSYWQVGGQVTGTPSNGILYYLTSNGYILEGLGGSNAQWVDSVTKLTANSINNKNTGLWTYVVNGSDSYFVNSMTDQVIKGDGSLVDINTLTSLSIDGSELLSSTGTDPLTTDTSTGGKIKVHTTASGEAEVSSITAGDTYYFKNSSGQYLTASTGTDGGASWTNSADGNNSIWKYTSITIDETTYSNVLVNEATSQVIYKDSNGIHVYKQDKKVEPAGCTLASPSLSINSSEVRGQISDTEPLTISTSNTYAIGVYNVSTDKTVSTLTAEAEYYLSIVTDGTAHFDGTSKYSLRADENGGAKWNNSTTGTNRGPYFKWKYTSITINGTTYNNVFYNQQTDQVIYVNEDGDIQIIDKDTKLETQYSTSDPVLSLGEDSESATDIYASNLFTTDLDEGTYIGIYERNSDGTVGSEATSTLDSSKTYYIQTRDSSGNEKRLRVTNNNGSTQEWGSLANTGEWAQWKYVDGILVNYIDGDPSTEPNVFIYFDGTSTVEIRKVGEQVNETTDDGCVLTPEEVFTVVDWQHGSNAFTINGQFDDSEARGYFIHATNSANINIAGGTFRDLHIADDGTVKNYAPIVINDSNFNMTSGSIENNRVGYTADDTKSGKQVTGTNNDGSSTKDYLKSKDPTKTAGGIIFTNGATGIITGSSSIKNNRGDAGGIIVNGLDTDVTLGGEVVYKEITSIPEDKSYFVKGNDGKYYLVDTDDPSYSDQIPSGVTTDGKMYDASINSDVGGGHIDNNVGFHYAGAALVENGATLRMVGSNSTMNNNVTWNKGGAVWVTEFGTGGDGKGVSKDFANKKINYDSNKVPINKQPYGEGTFIMTDGYIDNNTAFVRGGGINVESNRVFLIKGKISNNNCRALGGGIYVEGDYADYTYTLVLNRGYVGNNYSVRFWDLNNSEYPNVGGYWDRLNIEQLNDRLDRRISATTNETTITNSDISQNNDSTRTANINATSPLDDTNIAKGTGYASRTADAIDFYRPHQGRGGGIWLCPIGGTAIFHMNADNEVIIDDNYASGSSTSDKRKGTDIYLESGTGHLLVQNDVTSGQTIEKWENEETGAGINENSPVLSGPLYLINNTNGNDTYTDSNDVTTTYNQRKAAGQHRGIHIVDNISRDGGGIAGDGTMLFGIPNDLYRHEGRLDFTKIWPEENQNTQAVRFKMFYDYVDDQGNLVETVELPSYAFGLDGSNNTADDYTANPEQPGTNTSNTITWKANVTIPTVVERPDGSSYPMYKFKYNGTKQIKHSFTTSATEKEIIVNKDDILDPSTVEGNKKLYAIATVDPSIELEIVDWRIVVKEYDEYGKEIDTAEFKKIVGRTVTISNDNSIPIDVIDAGGVGKKIKGYNVNYSTVTFGAEVENSKGPKIEKYINNKVHRDLESYDQIFEYEIFAYVPENAEEIVIYDTLEEPLMFVSNNNTPQYVVNSNSVNSAFDTEFTEINKFFMIKNDSVNQMTIHENNNRYSDGTGTVVTDNGVAFTVPVATQAGGKNNPMTAGNVKIGNITPSDKDNNGNVKSVTESVSGDTLFIKIDKDSGIEAVQGKWVRIKFYAAIKPEYRNLNALKNDAGWLETTDSKVGSPIDYPRSIRFSGSGWNYLDGIESFVGKQFIKSAIASSSPNAIYRFAKDEYGNYYGQTISTGKWQLLDKNTTPTRAIAKLRFGETYDVATDGQGDNHGTNQFTSLDLSTDLLGYIHHDDFLVDTNEVTSLNGKHVKRGAYGNGKWMFIEDEFGDYYYATKSDYLDFVDNKYQLKAGITQANIRWLPVTSAGDDVNSPRKESVTQRLNGVYATKMDITSVNYNWPLVDTNKSQVPHYGEANQASYVVNGKNTYNSNIVTVDVFQPEKYVENKVHHLLNKGNQTGAEGAFDEPFEYSIIVKVPDDAQEIVIYDTLRPDLMFVDAAGNTQYETFTIGVSNGNNSTNTSDVTNSAFHKDDNSEYLANAMVVNTSQKYQLANLGETNNHIGNGTDPNATVRQPGTAINNYTAIVGTLQNTNTTGATKLGENLYIVETIDSNNNLNGKTLAVKIDNQDTINELKGKFVKLTFKAEIKPSAYDEVVKKLEKKTQYTRDITKAKDYDETTQTATPVGYLRKSSTYTYKEEEAIGYANGTAPSESIRYIEYAISAGDFIEGSPVTLDVTEALDYNYVTHEATPFEGLYAVKSGSDTFNKMDYSKPSNGVYNVDYAYLYAKDAPSSTRQSLLAKVIYLKDYDTFYAGEVPNTITDYVLVYENKAWDETETWATNNVANNSGKPNWEKVTDNGHIINPADTDENGVHAGLANDATYIIRNDSGYLTSKTNTVTVETKLRDLLFFKKWVVKETYQMPSMDEFKNHIHLMWEKANEEGVQSSEKKVGEITDLYRDKIKVAYNEAATGDSEGTRYYWTITVTDLPVLRGSLKYFLVEDNDIDGLSAPEYRNDIPPYGDSTTEHAHHYGTIVNIQQDEPGYTHVSVLKNWDVGTLESDEMAEIKQQQVQVQLMIRDSRTGTLVHAYKRNPDNYNAVITPKQIIETTLVGTGNSPWSHTFTDLPELELNDDGTIRPKKDSDGFEYYYDYIGNGVELGYKLDTDGYPIVKLPNGTTTKDANVYYPEGFDFDTNTQTVKNMKPVPVVAKYEIEVKSDPEGFILSKETKVKKQYQIKEDKLKLIPTEVTPEELASYGYYWKPEKEDGTFTGTHVKVEYTTWDTFINDCKIIGLPTTGPGEAETPSCYIDKSTVREYETSEVEIINTKPQIEKYVNKDVHDEIYFINDINYDILVYVPEEATEIVIEDKVLDTLKLKSFMKPVEDNSNIIVGYEELPLTTTTIPLAVHVRNDHKIYGTVSSKNAAGYINGNVSVDGNSFKITIPNIVHWAAEYIEDEYGDYIKTSNGYVKIKENRVYIDDSYTDENLQSKLLAQEIYRQDNLFYKELDITYSYREDAEGLYGLGSDNNYHLITDFPIMIDSTKKYLYDAKTGTFVESLNGTHYQGSDGNYYMTTDTINNKDGEKAYTIIVNSDGTYNAVGGRYVQVSFKATLNHDKDEELKEFIERISSMKPNSDFDWDVIKESVNDGWDAYIKQTLTNNSLPQDSKYVPASTNTIEESEIYMIQKLKNYLAGKDLTLSKAIKYKFNDLSNRLEAKDSAGNVYITYLNPKVHPWTEGKWFRAYESGNATLFEDISTGDSYSHGEVQEVSGDQSAAGYINGQVDDNSDLLSGNYIPVEPEEYVEIDKKYYLREEAKKYLPEGSDYNDATATIYHKIDWGLGDGHVIREYPDAFTKDKYVGDHTGITNTARYDITYGNGIKSSHKSNTVTVVPQIYELPSSGGMGTFLFNILGVSFITMALCEIVLEIQKRKKSI